MLSVAVGAALFSEPDVANASTIVYEDGRRDPVHVWRVYDDDPGGATARYVWDGNLDSRVVRLSGAGTANGYLLGGLSRRTGGWDDRAGRFVSWKMRASERFSVLVAAETARGTRYFRYDHRDMDRPSTNQFVINNGLGSVTMDNRWLNVSVDLDADLIAVEPGNAVVAVNGLYVRGNMSLDDIVVSSEDLHYCE